MKEIEYTLKHSNYRTDIDGLRAIAILAVIVFHLNSNLLPGGFTGSEHQSNVLLVKSMEK